MKHSDGTKSSGGKIPSRSDLRGRVPAGVPHRTTNYQTHPPSKEAKPFVFACWNVRTLLDSDRSNRPERRTALIDKELFRLNVDIAALSETRLLEEGSLTESHYTFYWKGRPTNSNRIHGVGFAIRNTLVPKLGQVPQGISERLMLLRYPVSDGNTVNLISAYAPTLDSAHEIKEVFYQQLEECIRKVPKAERLIILGDFNARVGKDSDIWPGVIGKNGVGNMNGNGQLLLSKCAEHDLVITNTIFRQMG